MNEMGFLFMKSLLEDKFVIFVFWFGLGLVFYSNFVNIWINEVNE